MQRLHLPVSGFAFKLLAVVDDSFKEFVLDQLSALPDVRAKAMFGAHGLYCDEKYEMKGKVVTMSFHEVPPEVLEQPQELVVWARKAMGVAALKTKKPVKRARKI